MQVELTVCNVCKDPTRATQQYEIRQGGRKAQPDLCEEDASLLEALLTEVVAIAAPQRRAAKRAAAPARRRRAAVMSIDEIEAGKRTGNL